MPTLKLWLIPSMIQYASLEILYSATTSDLEKIKVQKKKC